MFDAAFQDSHEELNFFLFVFEKVLIGFTSKVSGICCKNQNCFHKENYRRSFHFGWIGG